MVQLLPRSWSTLQVALSVSVILHAALLTVRFVDPQALQRAFTDTPLEVILVNARSRETPQAPQAIAQASLAGGGDVDTGRATSPLPPSPQLEVGQASEDAKRQQIQQLQNEQLQLLAQIRREIGQLPPPDPQGDAGSPRERQLQERRRQLLRLLAEIEKRIQEENARPKKRYISPATREAVYALYYDALRRKIEERGTRDFPQVQGRKLYGELTMNLTVDSMGRLVDVQVVLPSNSKLLDQRAVAIARAAGPFGRFSAAMQREADQIVVTSRFRFTREDGFETSLGTLP
jgi:protein TonB